jgi:hypothetical protein
MITILILIVLTLFTSLILLLNTFVSFLVNYIAFRAFCASVRSFRAFSARFMTLLAFTILVNKVISHIAALTAASTIYQVIVFVTLGTISGTNTSRTTFWTLLAPSIDTISTFRAPRNALYLVLLLVTLSNLPFPTLYRWALSTTPIVTRNASLIIPVGECFSRTSNQALHLASLIVRPTKLKVARFAPETYFPFLITFCTTNDRTLYLLFVALRICSVIF